jgi:glycosyltransferase involved in cell wall biosynthesis
MDKIIPCTSNQITCLEIMKETMRILWFSPTPSLYTGNVWGHNGGGWISSLESVLKEEAGIRLGIAFEHKDAIFKKEREGVTYYPISSKKSGFRAYPKRVDALIHSALSIIKDFRPDIIQLFGSEGWYGALVEHTDIPVIVHIQGSLPSYYNARYPVGLSAWDKIFSRSTSFKQKLMAFRIDATFKRKARIEENHLKRNHYFMGRTHWDEAIVKFYNPAAKYFHCDELLRHSFTESTGRWKFSSNDKICLISTISGPLYKGMDVILKTAALLKRYTTLHFEWNVCGVSNCAFVESVYKIKAQEVNVKLLGIVSQDKLIEKLSGSLFYIHPSYIDNSPNSVCEAQILGVPVICTNVGGVSSLVEDGKTGFLVPANDPLMIASILTDTCRDEELLNRISSNETTVATERHNEGKIKNALIDIYKQLTNSEI